MELVTCVISTVRYLYFYSRMVFRYSGPDLPANPPVIHTPGGREGGWGEGERERERERERQTDRQTDK